MSNLDLILVLKLAGAAAALGLGVWIGLGTPGLKRSRKAREWRSDDRLRATWINRMFFRMERPARRFDVDRLIVPKGGPEKGEGEQADGENAEASDVVRLRRPGRG